jgi:hypothetical protein
MVVGTAGAVAQAGTAYSTSVPMRVFDGTAAVLIKSSAGSITVTQQCSVDDVTFYDPVNTSNSALGAVAAAMTVGSRYVQPDLVPAMYMRFKVVEGNVGATVVTITMVFTESTF